MGGRSGDGRAGTDAVQPELDVVRVADLRELTIGDDVDASVDLLLDDLRRDAKTKVGEIGVLSSVLANE